MKRESSTRRAPLRSRRRDGVDVADVLRALGTERNHPLDDFLAQQAVLDAADRPGREERGLYEVLARGVAIARGDLRRGQIDVDLRTAVAAEGVAVVANGLLRLSEHPV